MRRIWSAAFAFAVAFAMLVQPAIALEENQPCVSCHALAGGAPGAVVDFGVGIDRAKCTACHWYAVHDFDAYHTGAYYDDYLSRQCGSCHHASDTWPIRPAILPWPDTYTASGWFQSATSLFSSAADVHAIHVNGSWLKGESECSSCHGAAACAACHGAPQTTHEQHGDLGLRDAAWSARIGKKYGDVSPDTYLYQTAPQSVYDKASAMYVGRTLSGEERIVMRFPLAKASGAAITSASLRLVRSRGTAYPLRVYRLMRSDWSAGQSSWLSYRTGAAWGLAGSRLAGSDYDPSPYAESSTGTFDVTALVNEARAKGSAYLDLLIVDPAPVAGRYNGFYASDGAYADWYPSLELEGTRPLQLYAYGPVAGTEPGGELPAYVQVSTSCIAGSCHSLAAAATTQFAPTCLTCHPDRSAEHGYEATMHTASPTAEQIQIAGVTYSAVCSSCHALELGPEHAKSTSGSLGCTACHPSPRGSFELWSKSCSQGGCHAVGSASEMHLAVDASHARTAQLDACSEGCHPGSLAAIHSTIGCGVCHASTDATVLAAIAVGERTCSACHGTDHAVTTAFCTGCHTVSLGTYAGNITYAQTRHAQTGTSAVARTSYPGTSYGTGSCMNCHATHSATTRAAGDQLCLDCHDAAGTTKPATYSYQGATTYSGSAHGSSSTPACATCHAVHGATSGSVLVPSALKKPEPAACSGVYGAPGCHSNPANSENGTNIYAKFSASGSASSHHDVYATSGTHIVCSNCHDPHTDDRAVPYANPRLIGTDLPDATDRYRDASGNVYALVGAQHDGAPPVVTSSNFYGSATNPTVRNTYWYTNEAATGNFEYGPTAEYGTTIVTNTYMSTSHGVSNLVFPVGTTWHYRYKSVDALGNVGYSADATYRVPWTYLVTAASVTGGNSAPITVSWATLGECETWVDFGPTTAYGSTQGSGKYTTSHSVTLSGLPVGTYHLRARSVRDGDVYVSSDFTVLVAPAYAVAATLTPVPSNWDIGGPQSVSFNWSQPNTSYAPFTYQLHVWDPYSSPTYDYTSSWMATNAATLILDGDHNYLWTVQAKDKDGTLYPVQSPAGSFALYYYSGGSGSCPFLYTWDGSEYVFESDEFAAGKLGLNTKAGFRKPNPLDYHVLATDPAVKDGALEYKLVEERAETDYLDQAKLYTVEAPADRDIWIERSQAEGVGTMTDLNRVLHTTEKNLRPPASVTWINTGQDVTQKVAASDGDYVMLNEDRNVDYNYQTLELDLGQVQDAPETKLVIDGRTCIPTTIAGRQRSLLFGPQVKFEVQDAAGKWVAVPTTNTILPKPPEFERPFVLDLSRIWISQSRKVRFTFLYKTYFDSILLDTSADLPVAITEVPMLSADLQPHGFDAKSSLAELYEFVYGEPVSPPTYHLPGYYTKFGQVAPLLGSVDDKFVIFGGGDELTMRFQPPQAVADGVNRKFLFLWNGYYKDLKQTIDHTVEPLPFAAMSNFPYAETEHYPDDAEHDAYRAEWNTRYQEKNSTVDPTLVDAAGAFFDELVAQADRFIAAVVEDARLVFAPAEEPADPIQVADTRYSVDTDRVCINITYSGSEAGVAPSAGWQSASAVTALPTPGSPGTPVDVATLSLTGNADGSFWRTDLATADGSYNWQLMRFNVPATMLTGSTGVQVQWSGHGEPTGGYPVKLYLWDFQTSQWVQAAEGAGGSTFELRHTELQAGIESFCIACHQASPPAGSAAAASYANISAAWDVDAHSGRVGTGFGGTLKAPYARGANSISCEICHDTHGSSNSYHLKNTINGATGVVVTTGTQYVNACVACHSGTVEAWHEQCRSCHQDGTDHTWGPTITAANDCSSCHKHGRVWPHPDEGCHGCGDPAGMAWNTF